MPDFNDMSPEELKKLAAEMQKKEFEGLTPEEAEEKKRQQEIQKEKNIALLDETMEICRSGQYEKDGETVSLGLSQAEMADIHVFLPDDISNLPGEETASADRTSRCAFSCEDRDVLALAQEKCPDQPDGNGDAGKQVLVLNLAAASRPGGASRDGMRGQEEDLCRRSTLLISLESSTAKRFYDYNNSLHTRMGSDAVMITPHVAVFRDETGTFLPKPFYISVMSCSAPMVRLGLEGRTEEEYKDLLVGRISGMLRCAASLGYRNLILGAFGCGAFGNDAAVVSDAFLRALTAPEGNRFDHVDFAVRSSAGKEYNFREFCRNFKNQ